MGRGIQLARVRRNKLQRSRTSRVANCTFQDAKEFKSNAKSFGGGI